MLQVVLAEDQRAGAFDDGRGWGDRRLGCLFADVPSRLPAKLLWAPAQLAPTSWCRIRL
jgi:hypothetical protein